MSLLIPIKNPHFSVDDTIVVNILIANIANAVEVSVFLAGILRSKFSKEIFQSLPSSTHWHIRAVILSTQSARTLQVEVWPSIQVSITTAFETIASESDFTFASKSTAAETFAVRVLVADCHAIGTDAWNGHAAACRV